MFFGQTQCNEGRFLCYFSLSFYVLCLSKLWFSVFPGNSDSILFIFSPI